MQLIFLVISQTCLYSIEKHCLNVMLISVMIRHCKQIKVAFFLALFLELLILVSIT